MHPNSTFRSVTESANLAFARKRGFGILAVNGDFGPIVSHVPFVISEDGRNLNAHLVRSNPMLKAIDQQQPAVMAISGPDGYISPDFYGVDDQVPTWNYVAVHLRGQLRALAAEELRPHLDELAGRFEALLAPKPIWKADKMTPAILAKMMKFIVPVQMVISSVNGTWKLSQNKSDAARISAADHAENEIIGQDTRTLAALMRDPPGK